MTVGRSVCLCLAALAVAGCAAEYKDAQGPSAPLTAKAPFIRPKAIGVDYWANLTVWDYTENEKGEMLGIRKLRVGSSEVSVRLPVGRKIALVMSTTAANAGSVGNTQCGVSLPVTPSASSSYVMRFDFPATPSERPSDCVATLDEIDISSKEVRRLSQFTAGSHITNLEVVVVPK